MVECIICKQRLMETFSYRRFKDNGYPICSECYYKYINNKAPIILPRSHKKE